MMNEQDQVTWTNWPEKKKEHNSAEAERQRVQSRVQRGAESAEKMQSSNSSVMFSSVENVGKS